MGSRAHLSLALDLTLRPRVLAHPPSRVARLPDDAPRLHARIMTRSLRLSCGTLAEASAKASVVGRRLSARSPGRVAGRVHALPGEAQRLAARCGDRVDLA